MEHRTITASHVALVTATLLFGAAMRWRAELNIWLSTSAVALVSFGLTKQWWYPRLRRLREPTWMLGAVVGGLSGAITVWATHLVFGLAGPHSTLHQATACLYEAVEAIPTVGLGVGVVLLVAGAEEVVWRGLALDMLHHLGVVGAVVGTAAWYALPMLMGGEGWLALASTALGLTWATLRLVTGSFTAAYVAHVAWTLGILFIWPLAQA